MFESGSDRALFFQLNDDDLGNYGSGGYHGGGCLPGYVKLALVVIAIVLIICFFLWADVEISGCSRNQAELQERYDAAMSAQTSREAAMSAENQYESESGG